MRKNKLKPTKEELMDMLDEINGLTFGETDEVSKYIQKIIKKVYEK